jgi:hypothetical protein
MSDGVSTALSFLPFFSLSFDLKSTYVHKSTTVSTSVLFASVRGMKGFSMNSQLVNKGTHVPAPHPFTLSLSLSLPLFPSSPLRCLRNTSRMRPCTLRGASPDATRPL